MHYSSPTRFVDSVIHRKRQEVVPISQRAVQPFKESRIETASIKTQSGFLKAALSLVSIFAAITIAGGGVLLLAVSTKGIVLQTVLTGSMNPALPPGAVSFVVPKTRATPFYHQGDIIAFKNNDGITVTHRVAAVRQEDDSTFYQTKGDANDVVDASLVPHEAVLGRSVFGLPYLGYFLSTLRTKIGFTLFILIPASLLAVHELKGMWEALQQIRLTRKSRLISSTALATVVLLALYTVPTFALFTGTVTISPNTVRVAAPAPTPSPTPSPSPEPTASPEPSPESSPEPSPSPTPTPEPCEFDVDVEQNNSNTGEGSTNKNTVEVDQNCEINVETDTTITNTVDATASTGNNTSSGNTDGGSVTSGDVSVNITIRNE